METIQLSNQTHRFEIRERPAHLGLKFSALVYQFTPKGKYRKEKNIAHYIFKTLEEAKSYIERFILTSSERAESRKKQIADKRQADKEVSAADFFKVGDIVVNTWGWEQTNVEFYIVTSLTAKTIKVQEIASKFVDGEAGYGPMAGKVLPVAEKLLNTTYNLKVKAKGDLSRPSSCYYFHKWGGSAEYCSWYN